MRKTAAKPLAFVGDVMRATFAVMEMHVSKRPRLVILTERKRRPWLKARQQAPCSGLSSRGTLDSESGMSPSNTWRTVALRQLLDALPNVRQTTSARS
jgi:hypothetical protein